MDKHIVGKLIEMWESGNAIDPEAFVPHVGELLQLAKSSFEIEGELEEERRQHAHTSRFLRQSDQGLHELNQILQHVSRALIRLRTEVYPKESDSPGWLDIPEALAVSEGRTLFAGTHHSTSRWVDIRRTSNSGKMLCVCAVCGRTSPTPDKECSRPMVGHDGHAYLCHQIAEGTDVPALGTLRWMEEPQAPTDGSEVTLHAIKKEIDDES